MRAGDLLKLQKVDPSLRVLAIEVDKHWKLRVLEGLRTTSRQAELVAKGFSKTMNSKHLTGRAVDLAPEGYVWPRPPPPEPATREQLDGWMVEWGTWHAFGGFVMGTAAKLGIPLRWGLDWNGNWNFKEETFRDAPHFELID